MNCHSKGGTSEEPIAIGMPIWFHLQVFQYFLSTDFSTHSGSIKWNNRACVFEMTVFSATSSTPYTDLSSH